jgi:hypothetical protein
MVTPTGVPPLTTTAGGATAPPVVFVGIHRGTQQFALRAADANALRAAIATATAPRSGNAILGRRPHS